MVPAATSQKNVRTRWMIGSRNEIPHTSQNINLVLMCRIRIYHTTRHGDQSVTVQLHRGQRSANICYLQRCADVSRADSFIETVRHTANGHGRKTG